MHLTHARNAQRGGLHALAERRVLLARLDVDDDVALGESAVHGLLERVGRGVALRDRFAGRDADHDVGEVTARRLTKPEPAKVDPGRELRNRLRGPPRARRSAPGP